jgi:hypothetical protein
MNEMLLRFLMMAVFISLVLGIAAISGELTAYSFSDPFESLYPAREFGNVTQLLSAMPLDQQVSVPGQVERLGEDFTSDRGYDYQQFYLTDGQSLIKVFCSKYLGEVSVQPGDQVSVTGKFQKFYQTLEIYTDCVNVNLMN